jgi:hypothetical protein
MTFVKKKKQLFIFCSILISGFGCSDPFANKKLSSIGSIYADCLRDDAWDSIKAQYQLPDSATYKLIRKEFEKQPFKTELLFFNDSVPEVIGIATDHYSVRYAYNPHLNSMILNGLSPGLKEYDKKRICNKIQNILMRYQCPEGKKESLEWIKNDRYMH